MRPTRRDVLKSGLGAATLVSLGRGPSALWARAATQAPPDPDGRVLVVLQLSGGNDGLNTVIPFTRDAYARSRPTLRWPAEQVLKLDDALGLHPRLVGCRRLFGEGRLGIVQGVGLPRVTGDHDRDRRSWDTAAVSTEAAGSTGWLGRAADALADRDPAATNALFLGRVPRPFALHAARAVVPAADRFETLVPDTTPAAPLGEAASDLETRVRVVVARARRQGARLRRAAAAELRGPYPASGLGRDLAAVARCLRAGFDARIYGVEHGGGGIGAYDNHANQAGNHDALLAQLSAAVAAFVTDLAADRLLERVLLVTVSEFGRTLAENGRRGTGHGNAAPVLIAGGGIAGGVHGDHPSLTDLDGVGLRPGIDFRRLYATVLRDWLGLPAAAILGGDFASLTILGAPAAVSV